MPAIQPRRGDRTRTRAAPSGGADNQPVRHFIDFSAEATRHVMPGRGYRILDMKPGTFE